MQKKIYFCTIFDDSFTIMEKIDELDRKILKLITKDARMPFKDVADEVGASRAAVHQRVQKMLDTHVIQGSGYTVNPVMLGYNLCVYIGITLDKGTMYDSVCDELEQITEVVESQYTLGLYSLLVKLYAKDNKHLFSLLKKIQTISGVAKTETLSCLEQRINRVLPV